MPARFDLTLVTYDQMPELAPDDRLLKDALEEIGLKPRAAVWSDPTVDWSASAHTLLRSTWDYFHRIDEFKEWLSLVEGRTGLINSAATVLWNMDKHYLPELSRRGVSIVPTRILTKGEHFNIEEQVERLSSTDLVIKPTISGSAYGSRRFTLPGDAAAAKEHAASLLERRDIMVQPFLQEVLTSRERSLVFLGGRFSHAYLKTAFSAGAAAGESSETVYSASALEITFAEHVLAASRMEVEYARVDFVPGKGGPLLMELELVEPALHFGLSTGSAARFADHLKAIIAP